MANLKLGIDVDTDTRATRQEFTALRRAVKTEADAMGDDWEAAAAKVEDALREAGARDDLIEAARRIGTEGPSEIERMQRSLRDLEHDAVDVAGDIKRAFGDNALTGDDLFDANFRAEIAASARETGSEILGQISGALAEGTLDMGTLVTSVSDGLVEIGAEVGGPAGGAMVAGGLIASALWGQITATKQKVQDDVSSMFDTILSEGADAAAQAQILSNLRDLTEDQDKLNFSTGLAKTLNEDLSTVLRARAGDEGAMAEVTKSHDRALADLRSSYEAGHLAASDYARESDRVRDALEDVTTDFDLQRQGLDAAKAATEAFKASTSAATDAQLAQAVATAKSTGQAQDLTVTIDGATRSLRAMPDGKVVEVSDDGTVAETQRKIDGVTGSQVYVGVNFDKTAAQRDLNRLVGGLVAPAATVRVRLGQNYE